MRGQKCGHLHNYFNPPTNKNILQITMLQEFSLFLVIKVREVMRARGGAETRNKVKATNLPWFGKEGDAF